MRKLLMATAMLTLVGTAVAFDLGNERPAKPETNNPVNVPNGYRQGGDTIEDAVPITIPYSGVGTTVGYTDDYDEECPYDATLSPDVVYSVVPAADGRWDIDLFGSTFDTKLYIYDENLVLIACNDDFYPDYVSKLERVELAGGVQYFVVIDAYGGDSGDYVINITPWEECLLACPPGAELESEPPLVSGYLDAHNGGCNSPEFGSPFGVITQGIFCGVSGFYDTSRDTDWFEVVIPDGGSFELIGDAELATYLFELGPSNCDEVGVIQDVTIGPCTEATMIIAGPSFSTIWFWAGPTTFGEGEVVEYDYVLYTNLVIAAESHSWSEVKALFD